MTEVFLFAKLDSTNRELFLVNIFEHYLTLYTIHVYAYWFPVARCFRCLQVSLTYTCVPLSPSSIIIWYRPRDSDAQTYGWESNHWLGGN